MCFSGIKDAEMKRLYAERINAEREFHICDNNFDHVIIFTADDARTLSGRWRAAVGAGFEVVDVFLTSVCQLMSETSELWTSWRRRAAASSGCSQQLGYTRPQLATTC